MRKLLILVVGLLLGVVATAYFLSIWHRHPLPGTALKPPDRTDDTSGTVTVTIDEKFFDSLLGTIFQKLGPPQLKLSQSLSQLPMRAAVFQATCNDVVVLNPEGSNVKTRVQFTGGKIAAPLAFSGSYSILGKCVEFKGTARATVDLSFDREKQTVYGRLNAEEVVLDEVPPIVSSLVTAFVRRSVDERLNPFEVLRVSQLALSWPIQASGGSLKAQVKEVRSEVQEGALRLYLMYDFSAEQNAG